MRNVFTIILSCFFLLFNQEVKAQNNKAVTGTVSDAGGGLPGVTISVDRKVIAQTSLDGTFRVTVAENAVLEFSYMGYKPQKINVSGKTKLTIKLVEDNNNLKEVSIVGYVNRTRETSVGSSVKISGSDLQAVPVADITSMLQGKVPGLNIQQNTGSPGLRGSVTVRGISSTNITGEGANAFLQPTSPLFVVDGVPIDDNQDFSYGFQTSGPGVSPIALIPQQDIENIEVLKDAAATALYGSRGAYGVILITTKRGNSKVPVITYNGQFFLKTSPRLRDVIGGVDERYLRMEQILLSDTSRYLDLGLPNYRGLGIVNGTPFLADSLNAYFNNSTNWQSYFYRTTYNQTHNLNISGGNQSFNYKVNFGYYDEKGVQQNTGFSRSNLRMNMQYMPSQKFRLQANVNGGLGKQQKGSGNGLLNTGVAEGGSASSLLPPPSLYSSVGSVLTAVSTDNDNKTIDINTTVDLRYEAVKNLIFNSNLNYTFNTGTEDNFRPAILVGDRSQLYTYNSVKNGLYNRNLIQYQYTIKNKNGDDAHNFMTYVFNELRADNFKADALQNNRGPSDFIRGPLVAFDWNISAGGTLNNFYQRRSVAFAGSFRYDYLKRYVLEATYRFDGSSSTGPDAGFTRNPSLGIRWNINNEEFVKSITERWLDYASLRFTYGTVIEPNGTVYDVYGRYQSTANYNGTQAVMIRNTRMPNSNLQPTQNTTLNFGFDFGLLKNRLFGTFEAYYKQTDNLFTNKLIANINGFNDVGTNEEALVNMGYEGSLTGSLLPNSSKARLTLSVNGAINRDYLAALPNGARQMIYKDAATGQWILKRIGKNALSNFIYVTKGIYANDSDVPVDPLTGLRYRAGANGGILSYYRAGDPRMADINGDYILDENDLVDAGDSQIRFNGGVTTDFRYKGFSVQVQGNFVLGRDVLNNSLASRFQSFDNPTAQRALVPISQYNIWTANGQQATYPNPYDYLRSGIIAPYRYAQTLFQEDGSYFKLGYVSLGYMLNQNFTRRMGMTRVVLGLTMNNVFMITNYSGPNPEAVSALGRDSESSYPNPRTYVFNMNIEF